MYFQVQKKLQYRTFDNMRIPWRTVSIIQSSNTSLYGLSVELPVSRLSNGSKPEACWNGKAEWMCKSEQKGKMSTLATVPRGLWGVHRVGNKTGTSLRRWETDSFPADKIAIGLFFHVKLSCLLHHIKYWGKVFQIEKWKSHLDWPSHYWFISQSGEEVIPPHPTYLVTLTLLLPWLQHPVLQISHPQSPPRIYIGSIRCHLSVHVFWRVKWSPPLTQPLPVSCLIS